ncbi:MAG: MaoC family dehydratase N-terminal domain-containing protein [Salinisphaera sp.]|nr:MaoC family dehydratase N-terminal domain-containing protein [Salinisphaera sp.]
MDLNEQTLRGWIGRSECAGDSALPAPLRGLAATLNRDDCVFAAGDAIPACWHWLYFLHAARACELGPDGHPERGGFLPPVALPRRMWAGSRMEFLAPLRVGQALQRVSTIRDVTVKPGRSGPLAFVKVRRELRGDDTLAIAEEEDIVYRDAQPARGPQPAGKPAPDNASWSRRIEPDPILLFRYSALTFNGHRIHYDRPYATEVEGYPGLVVHGPLLATLLLELLQGERPGDRVDTFRVRAVKPLFDTDAFDLCGRMADEKTAQLWARDAQGHIAMQATATVD